MWGLAGAGAGVGKVLETRKQTFLSFNKYITCDIPSRITVPRVTQDGYR